jgi:transposase
MLTFHEMLPENFWELQYVSKNQEQKELFLILRSKQSASYCPTCGNHSSHIHSHYCRTVRDLPLADFHVNLQVIVRKFFCDHSLCEQHIFTQRGTKLLKPYGRKTTRNERIERVLQKTVGSRIPITFAEQDSLATLRPPENFILYSTYIALNAST